MYSTCMYNATEFEREGEREKEREGEREREEGGERGRRKRMRDSCFLFVSLQIFDLHW